MTRHHAPGGLMRHLLGMLLACWLLAGAGTNAARADGKVFPAARLPQEVAMPDQRALLAWKDGVETLVIESAFVGEGTDFAWVVPLPAKPEVFAATRGTLPAAFALMQPVLGEPIRGAGGMALLLGGIGTAALVFGWSAVGKGMRIAVLVAGSALLAGVAQAITRSGSVFMGVFALGCLALWPLRVWIRRETRMIEVLVVLLIAGLLFAMGAPAFSAVRSTRDAAHGPEAADVAVERHVVGDFDVAVLSGREGGSVIAWLEDNGFALGEAARLIAAEHAAAGGWFVASKIRRELAESGRSVPAPLAFRFAAPQAAYPMRLTGVGATHPLELELLVFGPGRAAAAGMAAKSIAPLHHGEPEKEARRADLLQPADSRRISHPELKRWTEGASAATWLRGRLSPAQMQQDLAIGWHGDATALGLYAQASEDAWEAAALAAAVLVFLGAVVLGLVFGNGRLPMRWSAAVGLTAMAAAGLLRANTPTVETTRLRKTLPFHDQRDLVNMTVVTLLELEAGAPDATVRQAFQRETEKLSARIGRPVRVGDAPGEADLLKLPDGSWRVVFYDAYGQPRYFAGSDVKPEAPSPKPTPARDH